MFRTKDWQRNYLIACLSQICMEIAVYQTVECLWIYFAVPKLISGDVDATMATVHQSINIAFQKAQRVETEGEEDEEERQGKALAFNSSAHFFASRDVAGLFPSLFESSVVLAFHSFFPPSGLDLLGQGRLPNTTSASASASVSPGREYVREVERESEEKNAITDNNNNNNNWFSRLLSRCQLRAVGRDLMLYSGMVWV